MACIAKNIGRIAFVVFAVSLGGCATGADSLDSMETDNRGARRAASSDLASTIYGTDLQVRTVANTVKAAGNKSVISSRSVRLPVLPLREIYSFQYRFPMSCGGYRFRLYETNGTKILEFEYHSPQGQEFVIRDFLSGPNSFTKPGLWTAYDHTADSVRRMIFKYKSRGNGVLLGTYSQGPFTDLDEPERHALGTAYSHALREASTC